MNTRRLANPESKNRDCRRDKVALKHQIAVKDGCRQTILLDISHKTVLLHRLPRRLMFAQQAFAKRFHYASSSAA